MEAVKLDKFSIRHANKPCCDRCNKNIEGKERILSYFNDDTICMECSEAEDFIKASLSTQGKNPKDFIGCGFIPVIKFKMQVAWVS